MRMPRLVIAGLSGGSGKTIVSLGLARAWAQTGLTVKTFKKGPDYIDAACLALAAQTRKGNLDPFFSDQQQLIGLFAEGTQGHDVAIIEGNRGLFDGLDTQGSTSTAELARMLKCPVILVINCAKMTRTTAALVLGCNSMEPGLRLGGVILNNIATMRQRDLIVASIEKETKVPVLGALPRHDCCRIREHQLGLAYDSEDQILYQFDRLASLIKDNINLEALMEVARGAADLPVTQEKSAPLDISSPSGNVTIGYMQDKAFWGYYEENLLALRRAGATLTPVSLFDDTDWPELDALYIGGGDIVPHLSKQAPDERFFARLCALAQKQVPIYAEDAGLVLLCEALHTVDKELPSNEKIYPMAGILPGRVYATAKPSGLGYATATVTAPSAFFPHPMSFNAHEFNFSRYVPPAEAPSPIFQLQRGRGLYETAGGNVDGITRNNIHASFIQIYAPAVPHWAETFVRLAVESKQQ